MLNNGRGQLGNVKSPPTFRTNSVHPRAQAAIYRIALLTRSQREMRLFSHDGSNAIKCVKASGEAVKYYLNVHTCVLVSHSGFLWPSVQFWRIHKAHSEKRWNEWGSGLQAPYRQRAHFLSVSPSTQHPVPSSSLTHNAVSSKHLMHACWVELHWQMKMKHAYTILLNKTHHLLK